MSMSRFPSHLGETSVVVGHHGGVGAVQLPDDLKALVELSEDVHHRAGEQGVLGRLLELQADGRGGQNKFSVVDNQTTRASLTICL